MATTPSVYARQRPWQSNEERLTSAALQAATIPAEAIRQIRPVVPSALMPPATGLPSYQDRQIRITDIGLLNGSAQTVDYSQRTSGYSGSLRNGFPALNTF